MSILTNIAKNSFIPFHLQWQRWRQWWKWNSEKCESYTQIQRNSYLCRRYLRYTDNDSKNSVTVMLAQIKVFIIRIMVLGIGHV